MAVRIEHRFAPVAPPPLGCEAERDVLPLRDHALIGDCRGTRPAVRNRRGRPALACDGRAPDGAGWSARPSPADSRGEHAMHRRVVALAVAAAAFGGTMPALAQTTPAAPDVAAAPAAAPGRLEAGQMRAKALIDRDVYSTDGVEVGEIEDLILDAQGRVVTAVIEVESRLGFTEKYVAVPFDQLRPGGAERRVTLPMTRDEMRALPGFRHQD